MMTKKMLVTMAMLMTMMTMFNTWVSFLLLLLTTAFRSIQVLACLAFTITISLDQIIHVSILHTAAIISAIFKFKALETKISCWQDHLF